MTDKSETTEKVYDVKFEQTVTVTVDVSKFTDEFMAEFRSFMYPFTEIDQHVAHIGKCYMNNFIQSENDFLGGYGKLSDFGVRFGVIEEHEEAEPYV